MAPESEDAVTPQDPPTGGPVRGHDPVKVDAAVCLAVLAIGAAVYSATGVHRREQRRIDDQQAAPDFDEVVADILKTAEGTTPDAGL